jgi:invasion protein IalB
MSGIVKSNHIHSCKVCTHAAYKGLSAKIHITDPSQQKYHTCYVKGCLAKVQTLEEIKECLLKAKL